MEVYSNPFTSKNNTQTLGKCIISIRTSKSPILIHCL